jgi:hypothetical protein
VGKETSRPARVSRAILGAILLIGILGSAAAAGLPPLSLEGPTRGSAPPLGNRPGTSGPERASPTPEQERLLHEIETSLAGLSDLLEEASFLATSGDWGQVETKLLDYVRGLTQLEALLNELAAASPTPAPPRRGQGRRAGPFLAELAAQGELLASLWLTLPDANRSVVQTSLQQAASGSDTPRFWAPLLRLTQGKTAPDPARLREMLQRALERAEVGLALSRRQFERLNLRITRLVTQLAGETNADRRHALEDLKRLAELDLEVAKARIARDEFAILNLAEHLAALSASSSD